MTHRALLCLLLLHSSSYFFCFKLFSGIFTLTNPSGAWRTFRSFESKRLMTLIQLHLFSWVQNPLKALKGSPKPL
ncbi:hypothetical protein BY996DRAFT_7478051 [Phakopsora pachyrhizi]|nr:hypothetical protein BY996DRAFT_7478051 [Phakopsora pachyrhizi]